MESPTTPSTPSAEDSQERNNLATLLHHFKNQIQWLLELNKKQNLKLDEILKCRYKEITALYNAIADLSYNDKSEENLKKIFKIDLDTTPTTPSLSFSLVPSPTAGTTAPLAASSMNPTTTEASAKAHKAQREVSVKPNGDLMDICEEDSEEVRKLKVNLRKVILRDLATILRIIDARNTYIKFANETSPFPIAPSRLQKFREHLTKNHQSRNMKEVLLSLKVYCLFEGHSRQVFEENSELVAEFQNTMIFKTKNPTILTPAMHRSMISVLDMSSLQDMVMRSIANLLLSSGLRPIVLRKLRLKHVTLSYIKNTSYEDEIQVNLDFTKLLEEVGAPFSNNIRVDGISRNYACAGKAIVQYLYARGVTRQSYDDLLNSATDEFQTITIGNEEELLFKRPPSETHVPKERAEEIGSEQRVQQASEILFGSQGNSSKNAENDDELIGWETVEDETDQYFDDSCKLATALALLLPEDPDGISITYLNNRLKTMVRHITPAEEEGSTPSCSSYTFRYTAISNSREDQKNFYTFDEAAEEEFQAQLERIRDNWVQKKLSNHPSTLQKALETLSAKDLKVSKPKRMQEYLQNSFIKLGIPIVIETQSKLQAQKQRILAEYFTYMSSLSFCTKYLHLFDASEPILVKMNIKSSTDVHTPTNLVRSNIFATEFLKNWIENTSTDSKSFTFTQSLRHMFRMFVEFDSKKMDYNTALGLFAKEMVKLGFMTKSGSNRYSARSLASSEIPLELTTPISVASTPVQDDITLEIPLADASSSTASSSNSTTTPSSTPSEIPEFPLPLLKYSGYSEQQKQFLQAEFLKFPTYHSFLSKYSAAPLPDSKGIAAELESIMALFIIANAKNQNELFRELIVSVTKDFQLVTKATTKTVLLSSTKQFLSSNKSKRVTNYEAVAIQQIEKLPWHERKEPKTYLKVVKEEIIRRVKLTNSWKEFVTIVMTNPTFGNCYKKKSWTFENRGNESKYLPKDSSWISAFQLDSSTAVLRTKSSGKVARLMLGFFGATKENYKTQFVEEAERLGVSIEDEPTQDTTATASSSSIGTRKNDSNSSGKGGYQPAKKRSRENLFQSKEDADKENRRNGEQPAKKQKTAKK